MLRGEGGAAGGDTCRVWRVSLLLAHVCWIGGRHLSAVAPFSFCGRLAPQADTCCQPGAEPGRKVHAAWWFCTAPGVSHASRIIGKTALRGRHCPPCARPQAHGSPEEGEALEAQDGPAPGRTCPDWEVLVGKCFSFILRKVLAEAAVQPRMTRTRGCALISLSWLLPCCARPGRGRVSRVWPVSPVL